MTKDLSWLVEAKANPNIAPIKPGATVKVYYHIKEGDKERTQTFQGMVIRVRRGTTGASFTVRQVLYGIGVERTFFFNSPHLEKVELVQQSRVRRAKLYYVRGLSARASRTKLKTKI